MPEGPAANCTQWAEQPLGSSTVSDGTMAAPTFTVFTVDALGHGEADFELERRRGAGRQWPRLSGFGSLVAKRFSVGHPLNDRARTYS